MNKEFSILKDLLVTTATTANMFSLINQAPLDPILKGFLLGFLVAAIAMGFPALMLFLRSKKKRGRTRKKRHTIAKKHQAKTESNTQLFYS